MYSENKYTACVIGCGRAGFSYDLDKNRREVYSHLGMFYNSKKINKLIAVDPNIDILKLVKKKYDNVIVYQDYEVAFEKEDIDIVSIATPTSIRKNIFDSIAINNINNVFCEKPLADSEETAIKILETCNNNNINTAVNYFRMWDDFHIELGKFIKEDKLGVVKNIVVRYSNGVINTGSHVFNLLEFLFGKIKSVKTFNSLKDSANDPTLDVEVKFNKNLRCILFGFDKNDYRMFELDILGTKGRITVDNGYTLKYYTPEKSDRNSEFMVLKERNPILENGRYGHYENSLKNIIANIENNQKLLCDITDGYAALRLSLGCIESQSKNKEVYFY